MDKPQPSDVECYSQPFNFVQPTKLIDRPGFHQAYSNKVIPYAERLMIRGVMNTLDACFFQALIGQEGSPAYIERHPEQNQAELTYVIQGDMDMEIYPPNEHSVTSHMHGPIPMGIDLTNARFCKRKDGMLIISVDGVNYESPPTVTSAGSEHASTSITPTCIYYAEKGSLVTTN